MIVNETGEQVHGGKCAETDQRVNRKHPGGGAFTEDDLEWRTEAGFVVGWKTA